MLKRGTSIFFPGKKGIELQFHWIFVLIAGALILAFFFSVANKQKSISQEKLQLTLATDIDNILTGAIMSRGTAQRLPVPPQGIGFECTEGCECRFKIQRATKDFGDKPIFAPEILKDQDITVWALELKLPYRITNFLYLTNPNIKYYFVYDEQNKGMLEQLTKNIPSLIEYENITLQQMTSIKKQDYEYTKFILLDAEPTSLDSSFKKAEASAINIDPNGITFYEKEGTRLVRTKYLSYAGMPSLYAAIFAQDATMYECGLKTAFRKMSYIAKLYAERAAELETQATEAGRTICIYGGEYADCESTNSEETCGLPASMSAPVVKLLCQEYHCGKALSNKLDQSMLTNLNTLTSLLDSANRNFVQQSCPELF